MILHRATAPCDTEYEDDDALHKGMMSPSFVAAHKDTEAVELARRGKLKQQGC